ncbi:hypothetical protein WJX72_008286 [[Myrmecia] bisecta]|uniref:AAA+ ATPase domain-containing protein n=1 Tax=[Myrmecia] bisecta TaxID=41462 RepID=A0AAW1PNU8_9CHLO
MLLAPGLVRPAHASARPASGTPYASVAEGSSRQGIASTSAALDADDSYGCCHAADTGILLAAADADYQPDEEEVQRAILKYATPGDQRRVLAEQKKGKRWDPNKSVVADPNSIPLPGEPSPIPGARIAGTAWRVDKLKEMTYTQFWHLIREGRIDKVVYTADKRAVWVTTKPSAPGGVRTEKVGLPYDPDLFDHMVEHGVHIEATPVNQFEAVLSTLVRLAFPIWFAIYLVQFAFRIGRKRKRDKLFGGARMEMISSKNIGTTFEDIAGIDQVKAEIRELIQFLRNPKKFLDLGARSPAGVLLVGPPGTGKTLLAKAIAGEAGVPFFSAAGTEFMEMFVGIGASRVRDMFQKARKNAPCILFIDEFDGIGKQRSYSAMGNDESVHTINQLLTEMDGFEDNTGVVVMAATNRPAALDSALTRPGRFDRIIQLPLPNLEGRAAILKVHARGKNLSPDVDFSKVARATAGFTGAELMNLMNQSAIRAVRNKRDQVTEDDIFDALEKTHLEKYDRGSTEGEYDDGFVPAIMKRQIAVYEAARAIIGYITPYYDEISKVAVCPGGKPSGYTYFIPQEEHLESRVVTRGYMESKMVVGMAGRCGEKLVLGESNISMAGAGDLEGVNNVAREMVYRCGFSKRLGPVALMDTEEVFINKGRSRTVANIGSELARVALTDVEELINGAEAKAYYGLVANYAVYEKLIAALLERQTMTGDELARFLEDNGVVHFPDPFVEGFEWDENGRLVFPGMAEDDGAEEKRELVAVGADGETNEEHSALDGIHPLNPYQVRTDLPDLLSKSLRDL